MFTKPKGMTSEEWEVFLTNLIWRRRFQSYTGDASANSLTGDVFVNFATMPNGTPTTAATGQPMVQLAPATAIVQATVSNGVLVAADSGQPTTAAYTAWRLPEEVKSFYADVSFSDANDALGLIVAGSPSSIGNTAIHNVFTNSSWSLQYYGSSAQTVVQSGSFAALASGQKARIGWRISGNDFYFLLPDGTEAGPITSAATAGRNNQCAIFEHYRAAAGTPGAKIYSVSTNLFANPVAAGRTNLLLNQNNVGGAAWARTLTGPITGQTDAAGGTLGEQLNETTTAQNQYFYQFNSKAASALRYTQRWKVKLIGRDWIYLYGADSTGSTNTVVQYLNLTTNAYGTVGGNFTQATALIYPLGNGWFEVKQDFVTNADTGLYTALGLANADNSSVYAGDITKGMVVYDEWLYARS